MEKKKKTKCSFIQFDRATLFLKKTGGIDRSPFVFCIILIATSIVASLLLAIEQDGKQLLCNNESKFEKF